MLVLTLHYTHNSQSTDYMPQQITKHSLVPHDCNKINLLDAALSAVNMKAQLSLTNPRDAKAC